MKRSDIRRGEYAMGHSADRSSPTRIIVVDPGNFEMLQGRNDQGVSTKTIIPQGGSRQGVWTHRTLARGVLAAMEVTDRLRDADGIPMLFTSEAEAYAACPNVPRGTVKAFVNWRLQEQGNPEHWSLAVTTWEPQVVPRNAIRSTWADYIAEERKRRAERTIEARRKAEAEAEYNAWAASAKPVIKRLNEIGIRADLAYGMRHGTLPPKMIEFSLDLDTAIALLWRWDAAPGLTIPGGPS